jgi:hypothetical protein
MPELCNSHSSLGGKDWPEILKEPAFLQFPMYT